MTREEIRKIPELHKSITRKIEQLRYLEEKATAVPSGLSEGERVQTSPNNDAGKYVEAAADLNREILQDRTELLDLQRKAALFIDTVENPLAKKVLRHRYLECMRWTDISDIMGYVTGYLQQIERETTKELLSSVHICGI